MAEDDATTLMLSPLDYAHGSGATLIQADCGHQAWISAGGLQTQARLNARTMCMRCVDPADVTEVAVTPEIYADLVEEVGQEEADRLIALDPLAMRRMLGNNSDLSPWRPHGGPA